MKKKFSNFKKFDKRIQVPSKCFFCEQKKEPNYKDIDTIKRYITDRSKIKGRKITGLCQTHQRKLTSAIKRARFISFVPFIVRPV
jgi:small subunit ribosomal protein S18